jgi:16S rRNA processing protein RimM
MGAAHDEPLLEIGRIGKAHGLRGEVVVTLVSNVAGRLSPGEKLEGAFPGSPSMTASPPATEALELCVVSARPFQQRHLVQFDGVDSREAAEALRGVVLSAPATHDPDALFVHDLVGCEVVDQAGVSHGRVAAVQANPASDLLVGESGWLVPLRFVVERRDGQLVIDAPDGLFE